MPEVPVYNRPQIQAQNIPNARANVETSLETFGGGQSAANLGNTVVGLADKYATEEKKKADDLKNLQTDKAFTDLETRILYDSKNGALTKRGEDSFALPDQVDAEYKKGLEEISKGLNNADQKMAFEKMAASRKGDIDRKVQVHMSGERVKFDDATTESFLTNERGAAVLAYNDPIRIQQSLDRQQIEIAKHADRNGLPPEWVQSKMQDAVSKTQSGVVNRMLDLGDDRKAKAYFDEHKEQFSGQDVGHMEKMLEEGSIRGESTRKSDAIVAQGLSMSQAMEQVKKIEDPKIRDATSDRVRQDFQIKEAARRDHVEKLHIEAGNILDKTPDVSKIPFQQWNQFSVGEKAQLKQYAKTKSEGDQPKTNWGEYYDLKSLASNPETAKDFAQTDLYSQYRNKMGDSEFKELVNIQTAMRNGKSPKELDGYRTNQQIVNDSLIQAGYDTGANASKSQKASVAGFKRNVDEQVAELEKRNGKKATNAEIQNISDSLLVKTVTDKGFIWDTTKRAFELTGGDKPDISYKDIPKGEKKKIEEVLRKRNIAPNENKVKDLFLRKVKRNLSANNE